MAAMPNQLPHRIFVDDAKAAGIPPPSQQPPPALVQPWILDERDSFISWLRSEFAAANAIIDAMCQHLPVVASCPGEYDFVLNCVRQRRYNWTSVLHMQQYFSVEEVLIALQQVALKKRHLQQQALGSGSDGGPVLWVDSDYRRQNFNRAATAADKKENFVAETTGASKSDSDNPGRSSKVAISEEKISSTTSIATVGAESVDEVGSNQQEGQSGPHDLSLASMDRSSEWQDQRTAQARTSPEELVVKVSKNFQSLENVDGRMINAVEGLRICENVFSSVEIERLVSSLSDLQGVGRKVELGATGYRILGGKRFLKGKNSDHIQQNADTTEDAQKSSSQDDTADSLPEILQFIADRLLEQHVIPASKRPDSYIINFLGEGGYLPPQTSNQEFDQPFCIITLQSDCSMVFGRSISMESPREFRGQFRISASIGSVIVLQGNSAKLARYAVPALPTKRCCLILGKTLVKRFSRNMGFQRSSSSGGLINTSMRPAGPHSNNSSGGGGGVGGGGGGTPTNNPMAQPGFPAPGVPASPASPPQGGPFPPLPLPVMVPGWSPVPRPGRFSGTGVFLPYAAPNGPGRPMGSGHRSKGPVLQKMNSLPASFRSSQNGLASSPGVNSGKSLADEPGTSSSSVGIPSSSSGGSKPQILAAERDEQQQ